MAMCLVATALLVFVAVRYWPGPSTETRSDPTSKLVDHVTLPFYATGSQPLEEDPAEDGWETEALSQQVSQQWKRMGKLLASANKLQDVELRLLAVPGFSSPLLTPSFSQVCYQDQQTEVRRAETTDFGNEASSDLRTTIVALSEVVGDDLRFTAKVVAIEQDGRRAVTRQWIELSGRNASTVVEQHAIWEADWHLDANKPPRLAAIRPLSWSQTLCQQTSPWLVDCTQAVLGATACYQTQFQTGMNTWLDVSQDTRDDQLLGTPGLAIADVNGDGLDDLYVCQEWGLPNRLFLQQVDGTARDVSTAWGVDWLDASRSCLILDLDNDGDQDLVVAMSDYVVFAANRADRFEIQLVLEVNDPMSLTAADYDSDGDLDLHLCSFRRSKTSPGHRQHSASGAPQTMYFNSVDGGRNLLLRNDISLSDKWLFTEASSEAGLEDANNRHSYAAAWEDVDNDGDQDLYVANDFGPNNLYLNQWTESGKPVFVDVASSWSAEDQASGMSATWGDINRDGAMDLYVGNMFSSAGQRVTSQQHFKPDHPKVKAHIRRFARGNTLFVNRFSDNRFQDVSQDAGVTMGRWSWSSVFGDLNNDGWLDLLVANGYITGVDSNDL
jgi:hypothetical protein